MLTEDQAGKLRLLKHIVDFTLAAQAVLSTPEPEEPEPIDLAAFRTEIRNQVLAGSGVKAAWLGTLSTEPVYNASDIAHLGVTAGAAALLTDCRDELRAAALGLEV